MYAITITTRSLEFGGGKDVRYLYQSATDELTAVFVVTQLIRDFRENEHVELLKIEIDAEGK